MLNTFSKLLINISFEKRQKILKNLYKNIIKFENIKIYIFKLIPIYYIILIKINNDFKKRLMKVYYKN